MPLPQSATLLRAGLTAAILGYLATRIDMREAASALVRIRLPYLAVVLVLVAFDRLVMIGRWVRLLRAAHAEVPLGAAVRIYLVSSFVGSFLPAGVGGDAARAYAWSRQTAAASEAVASVAIDRLLGMLSIVILGLVGLVAWVGRIEPGLRQAVLVVAGFVVLAVAGVWWADRALATLPEAWQDGSTGRRARRLADALGRYRTRPAAVVSVFGLSIAVQLLRIWQAFLLGHGLGIDVGFGYYLVFMPVGLLLLLLPLSISGFGLPQGAIVWMLRPLGVPDAESFALSTLIILTGLAGNLPGALLYVSGKKS